MRDEKGGRPRGEAGSVLVLALLVMVLLSFLGLTLLELAATEHTIAYNAFWLEGALAAADAGVNSGINQLSPNLTTSDAAIPTTAIGGRYTYRSGHRADAGPQPLQFMGSRREAGYSLVSGIGYNASGYVFYDHQVNATGAGPRNAAREVEVQAEYGPVLQ